MRAHGWGGAPPVDRDEARERILSVARGRLDETGAASISDVAERVGVTRQTVYRYFPTTEDLLNAAALDAVSDLVDSMVEHVRTHVSQESGDAGDAAVEVVAYVYEHLRDDPALQRLVAPGRLGSTVAELTSPASIALGGELLGRLGIDWSGEALGERGRPELVEHLLRTLQSFLLDPGTPERSAGELRAYLQRWLAPTLRR
ncbi:TetR/AcrR family transcriptional regulator [Nocardioides sp.]|uniref:TetR/AcrR family transcriptional regulator n=1 Tax=Nocardioides sp. TaxID=35761 RepID=UPI002B27A18A|nr:TetR/AcrR family transcriptional regulator [Nocardioides sp.]